MRALISGFDAEGLGALPLQDASGGFNRGF